MQLCWTVYFRGTNNVALQHTAGPADRQAMFEVLGLGTLLHMLSTGARGLGSKTHRARWRRAQRCDLRKLVNNGPCMRF